MKNASTELLVAAQPGAVSGPAPALGPHRKRVPLSYAQQRLWFLEQLHPGTALYSIPVAVRMRGELQLGFLARAIASVIERHEVLRTHYRNTEGELWQEVFTASRFQLPAIELSSLPAQQRESELLRLLQAEARRGFNLAEDVLLRARLFCLGQTEHVLFLNMHHIASDLFSFQLVFEEIKEAYGALSAGRPPLLPELSLQYSDYALRQRRQLSGEALQTHLEYWRLQLAGAPDVMELPTDRPRPAAPSFRGERCARRLPAELTQALTRLSRQEGVTPFMLALAAFQTLLHRLTLQEDLLVGAPILGRNQPDVRRLIGFFSNTVVLRAHPGANLPFREFLRQVRATALEAYTHRDLPFEKLVEELSPARTLNHAPFFQVMFVLQPALGENIALPGLVTSVEVLHCGTAKFELTLSIHTSVSGWTAEMEFDCDLFERETIKRWLQHFEVLLTDIAAHPDRPLGELRLLTEPERHRLLADWNDTRREYPRMRCVQQLFEAQASKTPHALALAFGTSRMKYHELNARANQLANHLREKGVGPETRVGICVERSVGMVVAMLGILKAGGAYVPLDPTHPRERLAFMLADAQTHLLITEQRLLPRLPAENKTVICLDSDWDLIARRSRENLSNNAWPDGLAYVIYTSGSTGRPKGVAVPHRAINRLVLNTDYIQIKGNDRIAQASNASFDAATFEVWGALLNGAELVGISPQVMLSPRNLTRVLRREKISILFLTTALFNQLAAEAPDAFATVRTVLFGGEAVDPKWVRTVLAHPPNQLVHVYGPTENTTFSSWHRVSDVPDDATTIPIGRPIANTECYVLDERRQPVPIGVSGELFLGGDGLARGYLGQPELNGETFISSPFEPGSRLYKTGDRVRWRPDGTIEFLGRFDHQVKVRGFRVELGEIETALLQHPDVCQCVVVAHPDSTGANQLIAYVVPRRTAGPNGEEWRDFLRRCLPEFMVPAFVVVLGELPLTPTGKVDRLALPNHELLRPKPVKGRLEPRDDVERRLQEIWQEVLNVSPIGMRENFFSVGGHSLLAVRLLARIEKLLGKGISIAALFRNPTIEQLALLVRNGCDAQPASAIVEIQPRGARRPLMLVHGIGGGMFWGFNNLSRHLGASQPVFAFDSRGLKGTSEFESIEEMAAFYVQNLCAFQSEGPYQLGGYCFGGVVAYEMACRLREQGQEIALLALINSVPPNSRYMQPDWTANLLLKFAENAVRRIAAAWRLPPDERRAFIRWKINSLLARGQRKLGLHPKALQRGTAEEWVDLSRVPENERDLWKIHLQALQKYQPRAYPGHVTLFRSPVHPWYCSYDPTYGWDQWARGGVTVKIIPGAHETIMEEPRVKTLAAELQSSLSSSIKAAQPA